MKSNVAIRSNIFVRAPGIASEDFAFIQQVRGKHALSKLIQYLAAFDSSNGPLSQRQVAELAWETPCAKCGAIPEGPVTKDGKLEIVFRCPLGTCQVTGVRARTVLLDYRVVTSVTAAYQLPLSDLVQQALKNEQQHTALKTDAATARRRFVIKLTPFQHRFLADADIERALAGLIKE
jgi:hypothetical protein